MSRARHRSADVAALQRALLGHEIDRRQRHGRGRRRQAGRDRGAAAAGDLVGELEGPDRAGELEGELDPAAGGAPHLLGTVRVPGAEGRRGAELAREGQLVVGEVDGDDLARPGGDGTQQRAQADAAQADHRHRGAGLHPCGVDHRAHAGEHGAAEQRRLVERQLGVDLDQRVARHRGVLGKAGDAQVMLHRRAVGPVQPARAREQRACAVRGRARLAQGRPALGAGAAMAAGRHEHADHMIAAGEVGDARPDLLDDAGRLVPERHRQRARPVAVDHRQVGMAQARGLDPDQHLARARADRARAPRSPEAARSRTGQACPWRSARRLWSSWHASRCRSGSRHAVLQLVDQHPHVLRVVDRHGDQVHAAARERRLQRRHEILGRLDA